MKNKLFVSRSEFDKTHHRLCQEINELNDLSNGLSDALDESERQLSLANSMVRQLEDRNGALHIQYNNLSNYWSSLVIENRKHFTIGMFLCSVFFFVIGVVFGLNWSLIL